MLVTNRDEIKHEHYLGELIARSEKCILCTSLIDLAGLEKIEPYILKSKARNKRITLYSNSTKAYTPKDAQEWLDKSEFIDHYLALNSYKRLHSKIYYFERGSTFDAVIGSANLTANGLSNNEELSVHVTGKLKSEKHLEILNYLEKLNVLLKRKA